MITIVSGLPRSGTSLMMQILHAGGMEILTDNSRKNDVNNPRGYFEYEKVKSLQQDNTWLADAEGKVLKVIAQLVQYLPLNYRYKLIFMERNIDEILLSQEKMILSLKGAKPVIDKNILRSTFEKQVERTKNYIIQNSSFTMFSINYNKLLLNNINVLEMLNSSLDLKFNIKNALNTIDHTLYRNRFEKNN